MINKRMLIENIDVFVFDFDGVLTNNLVYINEDGLESVACNRSDGLAFNVLHKLNKKTIIISTEQNKVVEARAKKINVEIYQGIANKADTLVELSKSHGFLLKNTMYIGNDLNDYYAMKLCGHSICPADSHEKIKEIATQTLKANGGKGVVRELVEEVLNIDILSTLY